VAVGVARQVAARRRMDQFHRGSRTYARLVVGLAGRPPPPVAEGRRNRFAVPDRDLQLLGQRLQAGARQGSGGRSSAIRPQAIRSLRVLGDTRTVGSAQ
jgi:hypothetical protein